MKRIRFIALMAFVLSAFAALFVTGSSETAFLTVAVEWLEGFTGHLDGLALATVPAAVASGTAANADPPAEDPPAQPTQEQATQATSEVVAEAVRQTLASMNIGEQVQQAIDNQAPATQNEPTEVVPQRADGVKGDVVPAYQRRAVQLISAMGAATKGETERAHRLMSQVRDGIGSMTDEQREEEIRAAVQILKDANLDAARYQRALNTITATEGPELLPAPLQAELYVILEEVGVARRVLTPVTMVSQTLDLTSVATKPVANWTAEGALFTETEPTFGQKQLQLNKLAAITSWNSELPEDQQIALLPTLIALIGEAFQEKEDAAAFVGDGTAGFGGFTGILNLAGANIVTMPTGADSFGDLTLDNFIDTRDSLSLARRRGARWLMHPDLLGQAEKIKASDGTPLVRQATDDTMTARIYGYPVVLSEEMPGSGASAASTKFMVFGQLGRMLMGQGRGFSIEQSREAVISNGAGAIVYNAFQQDGTLVRASERLAYGTPGAYESAFSVLRTAA